MFQHMKIHPEVKEAIDTDKPVVALESTLITHGFSHPDNIETALAMEAIVRAEGAIPATIAILAGEITIGLSKEQIETLATTNDVRKCSVRDLPYVVARQAYGSTTVAATMLIAHQAGIGLFATGGIGGVHRGAPFDTSADLLALASIPITVVCAGAKAILDLPATLETLETQGVPVVGYQTDYLPAFYSRTSNLPLDMRLDTTSEIAAMIQARDQMGLKMGILITNPVPDDQAWPTEQAEAVIQQAVEEAEAEGITSKAVTPYLLDRVNTLSKGQSKQANKALLANNAKLTAQIAVSLSEQRKAMSIA